LFQCAAGCDSYSSDISWYINKDGKFVLKFLDEELKAKKVKQGYILTVANQTETSFQLLDGIDVGKKRVNLVYQFEKK
jgi:HKD family nuclease